MHLACGGEGRQGGSGGSWGGGPGERACILLRQHQLQLAPCTRRPPALQLTLMHSSASLSCARSNSSGPPPMRCPLLAPPACSAPAQRARSGGGGGGRACAQAGGRAAGAHKGEARRHPLLPVPCPSCMQPTLAGLSGCSSRCCSRSMNCSPCMTSGRRWHGEGLWRTSRGPWAWKSRARRPADGATRRRQGWKGGERRPVPWG